jgi:hypothetical protein
MNNTKGICNEQECCVGSLPSPPSPPTPLSEVDVVISKLDDRLKDLERSVCRLDTRLHLVLGDCLKCEDNARKESLIQSPLGRVLENMHDRTLVITNFIENLIDRLAI